MLKDCTTQEEFIHEYNIEPGTMFLGDTTEWNVWSKGIIGVTPDRKQIIYSYNKLVEALAEDYEKEYVSNGGVVDDPACANDVPDFICDAVEFLDYNTLRAIPYEDIAVRPIICMDVER